MATPHICAAPGDFAPAVLMPGDPRRAARIAGQLLDDAVMVTDVRGIQGFTGTHRGKPLSVMASGMGMPSMTIYATELFHYYGVQRLIRVGTCGGISPKVQVGDVIIALGAHTDSNMNQQRIPGINFSAVASFELARAAIDAAADMDEVHIGMVTSHDHFHLPSWDPLRNERLAAHGVLGVEMEAAGLFGAAAEFDAQALAVLTVSDDPNDPSKNMTAEQRETCFQKALGLATAAALS
ncbi:purine nucleoside phosphorylase [Propionibacterium sp. oral taxon 192 str. F0372]|uniref:purine-nucleoside phosphorylase n=1 Tax=Propionibacterium sp. oral taxon 192 TaxID=671222 RepID=UPI00035302D0|nr:purine-nucleoside phosphorylase [Propionibacterium sp. oral taxon 192]EPH03816.1 purine nucleoside phosphorylase [Propionibacterium sp. oral taxon 192 str. F0372]